MSQKYEWGPFYSVLNFCSHPKYRQALEKKFPSLVCSSEPDDTTSTASGVTNVTAAEEKPAA